MITPARASDAEWLARLCAASRSELGQVNGGRVLWQWLHDGDSNEFICVIRPLAFVHYRIRNDGVRVVYRLAVTPEARRCGLGRRLMRHVGRPVTLKTNATNRPANRFYRQLGMVRVATTRTRSGAHRLHVYYR